MSDIPDDVKKLASDAVNELTLHQAYFMANVPADRVRLRKLITDAVFADRAARALTLPTEQEGVVWREAASIAQDCPGIKKPEYTNVDPFWAGVAAAKVAIMQALNVRALASGDSLPSSAPSPNAGADAGEVVAPDAYKSIIKFIEDIRERAPFGQHEGRGPSYRTLILHSADIERLIDRLLDAAMLVEKAARASPAPETADMVLVPREPTDKMVRAALHIDLSYMPLQAGADRAAVYRAMLAASNTKSGE